MSFEKLYRWIYLMGVVLIFIGGYRLLKQLPFGMHLFSSGVFFYVVIQLYVLFKQPFRYWHLFEYLKMGVNILFIVSVLLLVVFSIKSWYLPFLLGLLLDFFANIFRKIKTS